MFHLLPVFNMSRYKIIFGIIFSQIMMFISAVPVFASDAPDINNPQYIHNLIAWRVYELTVMARNIMTWIRTSSPTLWIVFSASFAFVAVRLIKKLKKI